MDNRDRMSNGELFTWSIIIAATSVFAYHILRFMIHNHYL